MGALGRLIRTTAFKLSLVYLVVFSGLTLFLTAYISNNTAELLDSQISDTIDSEINSLSDQYERGGLRQLVSAVDLRSRRPGASLYLVADSSGRTVVGNVADPPLSILGLSDGDTTSVTYQRLDGDTSRSYQAIVRVFALPGGFKLLVGRDISEIGQLRSLIFEASRYAIIVIVVTGFVSWFFVGRSVLKRVENMAETSRRFMSGDLTHRLAVKGSNDEFDNLALSLNEMLDRIEALMTGLQEVSDNIAHDLKTPLNRLRGRLEETLRRGGEVEDYREAITSAMEEADSLIRIFDALLKIARMEAGSSGDSFEQLDAAGILDEIVELYEPVLEDVGGRLTLETERPLPLRGNRTLLSQALSNLIDNAIKYGRHEGGEGPTIKLTGTVEGGDLCLIVTDDGPGIAEGDRQKALSRFGRLDAARSRQGSGLGLSLVAAVAHLHGGSVTLGDAEPGLKASLRLPKAEGNPG
ncbi:ATP-binding protein [Pleomorphomonas sp. NRK KF1]|uniref:sensor histidine kinase n=1 Tax=Pleomorphomonas sp. NRK KF1 TaxID=2943000 RepID=UPI002043D76E|nr:ATP-binding protein [Pleomorphomonas sp. NRK KF1]MCM5555476.1 HAMP domain-containing histidine kinase [Pleomorphomonas sp. NRK KF1]